MQYIMDDLFTSISKIVDKTTKLEVYSPLNQHLLEDSHTVLWDKNIAIISPEISEKFRFALNGRICVFYQMSKILPFHEFCIALLCTVGYTFNHTTASKVNPKSFISAWRSMQIMESNTDPELKEWIRLRRNERTSIGYSNSFDLTMQNVPNTFRRMSINKQPSKLDIDDSIISQACATKKVVEVLPDDCSNKFTIMNKVTSTPEGQLDNLRIIHLQSI